MTNNMMLKNYFLYHFYVFNEYHDIQQALFFLTVADPIFVYIVLIKETNRKDIGQNVNINKK